VNQTQRRCSERKVKEKEIGEEVGGQRFTYQPNIFEAKDCEDEVDVSNQIPPPETIAVQEEVRVSHSSDIVTDGTKNIPPIGVEGRAPCCVEVVIL
jgi:hypothetical protein